MVHEARGENRQAAECYRKVIAFIREHPGPPSNRIPTGLSCGRDSQFVLVRVLDAGEPGGDGGSEFTQVQAMCGGAFGALTWSHTICSSFSPCTVGLLHLGAPWS